MKMERLYNVIVDGKKMLRAGNHLFADFDEYMMYVEKSLEEEKTLRANMESNNCTTIVVLCPGEECRCTEVIDKILDGQILHGFKF